MPAPTSSKNREAEPSAEDDERQRFETLQSATQGVTHDLNNVLMGVLWHLELALTPGVTPSERDLHVEIALRGTETARALTGKLTAQTRAPEPAGETYFLGELVQESEQLVLHGSSVVARTSLPEELWLCEGDAGSMRRVLDNLLLNAREAMPNGGSIAISAQNVELDRNNREGLPPGAYVAVSVTDTGPGIPEPVTARLFVDHVSTKDRERGVGLATCRTLVENDGGAIFLETTGERGTTFRLLLRASADRRSIVRRPPASTKPTHVLVVDDDPQIRRLFRTALEQRGYRVELAGNASEAVLAFSLVRRTSGTSPIVILDLALDGTRGGLELTRDFRNIDGDARIIASTGRHPTEDELLSASFSCVLTKPYALGELLAAIQLVHDP
ncbi:MAG TPA: ATP-binding protein [Polyangiaceae bacterium]|nr:ATP-binding protein [Polyangiaceae bacterium]